MKALKVFALAVLMILVAVPFAGAQTITWNSSFTVVNLSTTSNALVTATFYDEAGTPYVPNPIYPGSPGTPNPFTLTPGGSIIIVMAYVNSTLPNGRYSVVLSSDQPIVAIANLAGAQDPNVTYNGSYSGSEDTGQVAAYLPSVSNAFYDWYSHLAIQNLTANAMDVTVNFYAGTPTSIAMTQTSVPAYASWHLDVANTGVPTNYNGSAVVTAAGPVAVVNNDYNELFQPGAEQTYSGAIAGSTDQYCPGLYDQFLGWISSLNVQNIGTTTATITLDFSDAPDETYQVGPRASYLGVYMGGTHPAGFFSVHVTGNQPLVAIANATLMGASSSLTYECAPAGATELRSPIALKWFMGAYNTGFQVQNIGSTAADICIEYEGYPSDDVCATAIAPNAVAMFVTSMETFLPASWSGAARVYSTNPLVGIVNQNNEMPGGAAGDFALSFRLFDVATP